MSTPYPPPPGQQPDPQQPEQPSYGGIPYGSAAPDPQQPYPAAPPAYGAAPAYGSAPPVGYGAYGAPAAPGKGLAIAGLITAIVPCTLLVGLVLSIVALVKANRGTAAGKGMAVAGIVISLLWLVGGVVAFALGIGTLVQTCSDLGNGVHYVDGVTYTCNF